MALGERQPVGESVGLARELGFGAVVRLGVSSVSPASAVFVILPTTIVALGWGTPLAILGAAVLSIPIAISYSSLGRAFPSAGGEYVFADRFLGREVGQAAWLTTVSGITLVIATLLQGAASLLAALTGIELQGWTLLLLFVPPLVIATRRTYRGARIATALLVVEIGALAAVAGVGLVTFATSGASPSACASSAFSSVAILHPATLLATVSVAYFALSGFGSAIILGEEDRESGAASSRAVGWSLLIAVLLELGAVVAVLLGLGCVPAGGAAQFGQLLSDFPIIRDSLILRVIVLGGATVAVLNAVVVISMQVGRIVFSGARQGYLPDGIGRVLKSVDATTQAPIAATLTVSVIAGAISVFAPPAQIVSWAGAAMLMPPAVVAASHLSWNRARAAAGDPACGWFSNLVPLSALVGIGAVALFVVGTDPPAVLVGFSACKAGMLHAFLTRRRSKESSLSPILEGDEGL